MQYRDVLIHTDASLARDYSHLKAFPPIRRRIDLSAEIWIGPLDAEVAKSVLDACDKRTFGPVPHVRMSHQLYAFVRESTDFNNSCAWDNDHRLEATVAVSRLVHPTSAGLVYAARLGFSESGVLSEIFPAVVRGISAEVFLSPERERNWLVDADAEVLRELVPLLPLPLAPRIHNAFWHHEYAAKTYYLDHKWTLVCTGLEALVHTDRKRSTRQFVRRVPAIASELGLNLREAEAEEAYDMRSQLAHGASFIATGSSQGPSASQVQLYDRVEDVLRHAILKGMRSSPFGDIFRDDDAIRKRWPI
jgi:hypothetical protein